MALVKAFLKAGIIPPGQGRDTTGTPQGGILSPLLANIALSALDDHFDRQWQQEMGSDGSGDKRKRGVGNWRMIRFADDFVVMVHGERRHAEALREEVTAVLAPLGLRLAPEKTRVVHIDEGFDVPRLQHPQDAETGNAEVLRLHQAVPEGYPGHQGQGDGQDVQVNPAHGPGRADRQFQPDLAGWANYHRHGVSKAVFSAVDHHAWNRIMRWIRAKYKQGNHRIGMPELRRRFCDQGWRFACNGVVFTGASSVAVTRYRYRGSTIPTPWTPAPAPR